MTLYSAPLAERCCLGYGRRVGKGKCHVYLQTNYAPIRLFLSEFVIVTNNDLIIANTSIEKGKGFNSSLSL